MQSLWEAIDRRREDVVARGSAYVRDHVIVRRTRETGAQLLGRAEREATKLQTTIASRRGVLNGKPIEKLERRVLTTIETVLERVGLQLRDRIQRLTPGAKITAIEPETAAQPEDATLVDESEARADAPARAAARAPKKKRIRVAVEDAATPSETVSVEPEAAPVRKTSNGHAAPKRIAKPLATKPERPAARRGTKAAAAAKASTRWVGKAADAEVDQLSELSAKALLARIPELDEASCRALLAREKDGKKRKTIVDALAARLPS
ncbi:hypothetical protein [Sandaracinus amylolyticus]|uniref:hypothetical protein n=1 Tax=Sandaracinus amylolyticus TaxID=927083 RepID=UPI001F29F32A|nr:hypothetical protein [Sandaracinus amylolyticus]UJR85544.1 Hypothetical protein I5071_76240 [Sandaracinus amylolyticus]